MIEYNENRMDYDCWVFWRNQRTPTREPLYAVLDGDNETLLNQAIECYCIYEGDAAVNHLMWAIESYRNYQQWITNNLHEQKE